MAPLRTRGPTRSNGEKQCRLEFYLTILSKQAYLFIPKIVWSVIALNALYFLSLKGLKINS